jgi:hypothetical protein
MAMQRGMLETNVHSVMNFSALVNVHTLEIEQRMPRSEQTLC